MVETRAVARAASDRDVSALPRIGVAAAMAVFLVARDVASTTTDSGFLEIAALLMVILLASSGIIHMLTNVWHNRRVAFIAFGAAGVLAFFFLSGASRESYLLATFWIGAEAALLFRRPVLLSVWSALAAGYVLGEIWTTSAWTSGFATSIGLQVFTTAAVLVVAGSLTAAALAMRAAQRERAIAAEIKELDDMKTAFLEAVSHELRTPLAAVYGYALLLEHKSDRLSDEKRKAAVHNLADGAKKLDHLLSDLLDINRLNRGIVTARRVPTDVAALVRKVVAELGIEKHEIEVDGDSLVAEVDAPKVERIIENLLTNADKYTPKGSPISIRIEAEGTGVAIHVEDQGDGVPDDLKESIFGAFERGNEFVAHQPGVGIGLSLVARFAELHGGRAWVEDRPGGGASFRVSLPGPTPAERVKDLAP